MESRKIIDEIKENISKRTATDKIMWFSFWFLLSIITFGLALFPMIYSLIERRNRHFQRQGELENLILTNLRGKGVNVEVESEGCHKRNTLMWTLSTILVIPVFIIAFLLSRDLLLHERRQVLLFRKILVNVEITEQKINLKLYVVVTLATLGFGVIYWFYKIFNDYNNHFKEQWRIEDKLLELFEEGRLIERN